MKLESIDWRTIYDLNKKEIGKEIKSIGVRNGESRGTGYDVWIADV